MSADIKTWRARQLADDGPVGHPPMHYADKEIADLRATLAKYEAQMLRMATCAGEFARDACKVESSAPVAPLPVAGDERALWDEFLDDPTNEGMTEFDIFCGGLNARAALSAPVAPVMVAGDLPPLPTKECLGGDEAFGDQVYGFTVEQMQDYARAALSTPVAQAGTSTDAQIVELARRLMNENIDQYIADPDMEAADAESFSSGKLAGVLVMSRAVRDLLDAEPQDRAAPAAVPDGWQLAPKEPTEAMQHAAEDVPAPRPFGAVYRAMLAAMPAAPGSAP